MESLLFKLVLIVVGIAGSAYFSAGEISIIAANRLGLRQAAKHGQPGAALAVDILQEQEQMLTTTLIGVNLFNLATAAFATSLVQSWLGIGWQAQVASTAGVTLIILVLGEMVPKVYGKQRADRFIIANARPLLATEQLFLPITAVIRFYLRILLRIIDRDRDRPLVTREELKLLVRDVPGETGHGRKEKKMLRSLLGFSETTAREVMVPMTDVISIEKGASTSMLRAIAKRNGFTRIPVYERRIDKVVGQVNVYDVLFDPESADYIEPHVRPVTLVPETKRIDRLMVEMQREHQTMVVIVSEFGACVGILTLEDILEEIVGEISEEDDVGVRKIREVSERTYVVDALADIDDVNDQLGLSLPKDRFDTVAGLLLKHYGRIPEVGEICQIDRVELEVMDTHEFGVRTVKLVLPVGMQAPEDG